ncbi:MAG: class I SAM-dependent methyltransferase, partial [Burkholderiales bacterium]|nr:class I SAM-dependent methyltransferase [Burkholderiales bacterium]
MTITNPTSFVKADVLRNTLPTSVRRIVGLLEQLQHGVLTVHWPDGQISQFGQARGDAIHASLHLYNWNPLTQAQKSGDIGFAESFIAGDWTSNDIPSLLRLCIANRKHIDDLIFGHWLGRTYYRIKHLLKRNTRANSQKNIQAHYDLGNAFYKLWLDETMNYSSAWFDGDFSSTTSQAQSAKVRRALHMAGVQAGDRVMEIGCGWGALAEMGALDFGAQMYGVTLSHEQLAFAQERLHRTSGQA